MATDDSDTSFPFELPNGVTLHADDEFVTADEKQTYIIKNVFRDVSGLDKETLVHPQEDGTKHTYIGCKTVNNAIDPREAPRSHVYGRAKVKADKFVQMLNDGEIQRSS